MTTPTRLRKLQGVVANRQAGLLLVLEDICDRHNAGALLRTAEAFGVQEVWFIFERETPYHPGRAGRLAAASAAKWIDVRMFESTTECLRELRRKRFRVIAATLTAPSLLEAKLSVPMRVALLLGNEHRGLSSAAVAQADATVSIPMRGMVESLNVSTAAAILLYELTRARIAAGRLRNLSRSAQQRRLKNFLER